MTVVELASIDVVAAIRRTPVRVVPGDPITKHHRVALLARAAAAAVAGIRTASEDTDRAASLMELSIGACQRLGLRQ